jgi:hypothetical protein
MRAWFIGEECCLRAWLARACSIEARLLTDRRDEHSIGERPISNPERFKQARHDRKSEVESWRFASE